MSRFKIKPPKKPLNVRRAIESLTHTLHGTTLIGGLIYPPITDEERARATFVANSLLTQLGLPEPPIEGVPVAQDPVKAATRHRAVVVVLMFQQILQGVINFMQNSKQQRAAAHEASKAAPPIPDASAPLTDEEKAKIRATLEREGLKFEEQPK